MMFPPGATARNERRREQVYIPDDSTARVPGARSKKALELRRVTNTTNKPKLHDRLHETRCKVITLLTGTCKRITYPYIWRIKHQSEIGGSRRGVKETANEIPYAGGLLMA